MRLFLPARRSRGNPQHFSSGLATLAANFLDGIAIKAQHLQARHPAERLQSFIKSCASTIAYRCHASNTEAASMVRSIIVYMIEAERVNVIAVSALCAAHGVMRVMLERGKLKFESIFRFGFVVSGSIFLYPVPVPLGAERQLFLRSL